MISSLADAPRGGLTPPRGRERRHFGEGRANIVCRAVNGKRRQALRLGRTQRQSSVGPASGLITELPTAKGQEEAKNDGDSLRRQPFLSPSSSFSRASQPRPNEVDGGDQDFSSAQQGEQTLGAYSLVTLYKRLAKANRACHAAKGARGRERAKALFKARGALRRLRTVLRGAESAVKLPEGARPDNLTPALQKLGSIRDVDVVVDILTNAWERVAPEPPVGAQKSRQPQLPAQLVAIDMRDVLRDLDRVRTERVEAAADVLGEKQLRRIFEKISGVVAEPKLSRVGRRSALLAAPDLLLSETARLFAQDGWHLQDIAPASPGALRGTERSRGVRREYLVWERALGVDSRRCERLHDLRKGAREMRYALESFQPLYAASPPFQRFLDELVLLQQALGAARDIEVALELAPEAARCPALLAVLREDYEATFRTFVHRRERVLEPELRSAFVAALFHPK